MTFDFGNPGSGLEVTKMVRCEPVKGISTSLIIVSLTTDINKQ